MLIAWSLINDIDLFSTFLISVFGMSINVYPKKILLELNFEWKHILCVVI